MTNSSYTPVRPRIYAVQTPAARFKRTVLVVVAVAIAAVVGPQAFANDGTQAPAKFDTYTVAAGETLWSIAQSLTPADGDVRTTVDAIKMLNAMPSSSLDAGEQILIPVAG